DTKQTRNLTYLIRTPNEGEEVLIREAVHDGWRKLREITVPTDVPDLEALDVELNVNALVWVGRELDGLRDDICVGLDKGIAIWRGSKILRRFESSVGFVDGTLEKWAPELGAKWQSKQKGSTVASRALSPGHRDTARDPLSLRVPHVGGPKSRSIDSVKTCA
ncbi:hypothetical protein POSPLADRAFT_1154309, partial [Postia placenta MAD-698-R-SB12]